MNIFVLDTDPVQCAKYHADRHVVKMILESCQLLSTAARMIYSFSDCYLIGWQNHPCSKWVRQSDSNFAWLFELARNLSFEYQFRYTKRHKCCEVLDKLFDNIYRHLPDEISCDFTTPYLAMPDIYRTDNVVQSYRDYYLGAKQHLLSYTKREIPYWIKEKGLGIQKGEE